MPPKTPEILVEPGMQLTVQGDIGGFMVALEQRIPVLSFEGAINEHLDVMRRCFARQHAQVQMGEKTAALQIARELLEQLPAERTRRLKGMAEDHARMLASFQAAHEASGKHAVYRQGTQEKQKIAEYEANVATAERQHDEQKARYEQDIRIGEMQIARLKKLIDADPVEEEPLREAAE